MTNKQTHTYYFIYTIRCADRAARLTNASDSPETPFGRLSCIIKFYSINKCSSNVYGTIDNKNVRRNRIGENLGEDNGSMVYKTKLLNQ